MRELKLQLNIYSPRDYIRIQKHLTRMAEKGWKLEQIDNFFWRYRICEPKKLRYSVMFFQNLDWEEPYRERCEAAGWTFVTGFNGMQIFCTEDPDLAPIPVAPTPRWKAIHRSVKHRDRWLWLGMCILALLVLANTVFTGLSDPVEVLADGPRLMYGLLMVAMLLFVAADALHYYIWRNRARREFNKTGQLTEPTGNIIGFSIGVALLAVIFLVTLVMEDPYGRLVSLLNAASILITLLAVTCYRLLKKRKSPDAPISPMMVVTIAMVTFVLLGVVQSFLISKWDFTCAPEDLHLTVQELSGEEAVDQSCLIEEQNSPLLADLTGRNIVGPPEDQQILQYRITNAKKDKLVDFCHENCLPAHLQEMLEPQDTALWSAEGVWLHKSGNGMFTYYIYYPDRAATLLVSWELNDRQIQAAAKAFLDAGNQEQ